MTPAFVDQSETPSVILPTTPPPSLSSTAPSTTASQPAPSSRTPTAFSYTRDYLLQLLHSPSAAPPRPPAPRRLSNFAAILRAGSVVNWGIDEEHSQLLLSAEEIDGEPISKALPIPNVPKSVTVHGDKSTISQSLVSIAGSEISSTSNNSTIMFDYQSPPDRDPPRPIMISFSNPDPFNKTSTYKPSPSSHPDQNESKNPSTGHISATMPKQRPGVFTRKASSVFQQFPGSVNSSSSSLSSVSLNLSDREDTALRGGAPNFGMGRSRSSSFSSEGSSINSLSAKGMNPFAAPFLNPSASTTITKPIGTVQINSTSASTTTTTRSSSPSLTEHKTTLAQIKLQKSLPARPNTQLPPVFVKRESATLPQPMSLPNIAPLGHQWEGEYGLSGNDKRRRASAMGLGYRPLSIDEMKLARLASTAPNKNVKSKDARPEHLVRLGQKIRNNSVSLQTPPDTDEEEVI